MYGRWMKASERTTLGLLTGYVRNATNGWAYTLDHLGLFFDRALAVRAEDPRVSEIGDWQIRLRSPHNRCRRL